MGSLFNVLRNLNGTAVATSVQRRTYAVLEEGILLRRQIVLNSTRVFDSIQQCFEAIKRLLSWFWRLPKTIKLTILKWLTTLQHAFAVGVHASKLALKAIFYAFALLILVLSAFALLRLLRRCYKNHRQNKLTKLADEQWRRRREEIEQQRRTQQAAQAKRGTRATSKRAGSTRVRRFAPRTGAEAAAGRTGEETPNCPRSDGIREMGFALLRTPHATQPHDKFPLSTGLAL